MAGSDGEDSREDGEKKPSRLPRKHFEWNDTIRYYEYMHCLISVNYG